MGKGELKSFLYKADGQKANWRLFFTKLTEKGGLKSFHYKADGKRRTEEFSLQS
jgi:hypothetical protein